MSPDCHTCGTPMERVGQMMLRCPECGRVWRRLKDGTVVTIQPPKTEAERDAALMEVVRE